MRSWLSGPVSTRASTSLVLALAAIWIALAVVTDGIFLSPRNLYNLSIQTCVTALMACGMVFHHRGAPDRPLGGLADGLHRHGDRLDAGHLAGLGHHRRRLVSIGGGLLAGALVGVFQGWWAATARCRPSSSRWPADAT